MTSEARPWMLPFNPRVDASSTGSWLWSRIQAPSDRVCKHIEAQGLCLRPKSGATRGLFDASEDLINLAPQLAAIVKGWVGQVHLLDAGAGFDISHSEPQWPSRIFVSIPERSDVVGALRLSESIIHEAMHLHLTGYEAYHDIVDDEIHTMASPWRKEPRPYRGVAHGLFVFSCISAFFADIAGNVDGNGRAHLLKRSREIRGEIETMHLNQLIGGLTPAGIALVREWRSAVTAVVATTPHLKLP